MKIICLIFIMITRLSVSIPHASSSLNNYTDVRENMAEKSSVSATRSIK